MDIITLISVYGTSSNWCEPNVTTNMEGRTVTAREWGIITCYNGTGGCPRIAELGNGDDAGPQVPVVFHPETGTWTLHENKNRYVSAVFTNTISRTVEY